MNDETPAQPQESSESPPTATDAPAAPPAAQSRGRTLPLVLSVLALGLAAATGWQWYEMRGKVDEMRSELAQRLSDGDTVAKEARGIARQGQESIDGLQAKVAVLQERMAESQGQAEALEALYQEFSRSRDDRTLAEVEQAITIAGQQLQLAGNIEAALVALEGAQARLDTVEAGHFALLRKALATDIERLKSAPQPDVKGISLKLEALQTAVDALPMAFASEAQGEPVQAAVADSSSPINFLADLAREIWKELRGLVRVERLDRVEPALLAPTQSVYLKENLRLRLLSARLGLLARDGRSYATDLKQAAALVERYFDTRDAAVQGVLVQLGDLADAQITPERPSINDTLSALRVLQSRPLRTPPAPQAPAAEHPAPAR
jgi:uroporphyrin-3 C-methyltransferase